MLIDQELLEEISDWKLEAKLEDNDKYFYHFERTEVDRGRKTLLCNWTKRDWQNSNIRISPEGKQSKNLRYKIEFQELPIQ